MSQNAVTKILSERLKELTENMRDTNYKLSDSKQADEIGIPYQTFRKYLSDKMNVLSDIFSRLQNTTAFQLIIYLV